MQTSEEAIGRFEAFEGRVSEPELLDEEGRPVRDLAEACELRVTKRGPGGIFTIRLSLEDARARAFRTGVAA